MTSGIKSNQEIDLRTEVFYVLNFELNGIDSSRALSEKDLGFKFARLPQGMRKYLEENYISTDALRPQGKIRKRGRDFLATRALNTTMGWVINPEDGAAIAAKFDELAAETEAFKQKLIEEFDSKCDETEVNLRRQYPDFKQVEKLIVALRKARPDHKYLLENISFTRGFTPIGAQGDDTDPRMEDLVTQGHLQFRGGLWGKLLADCAQMTNEVLRDLGESGDSGHKKTAARTAYLQCTVERASKVIKKLRNLTFIDERVAPLATLIQQAFDSFPKTGPLRGRDAEDFGALLKALSNQRKLAAAVDLNEPLIVINRPAPTMTLNLAAPSTVKAVPAGGGAEVILAEVVEVPAQPEAPTAAQAQGDTDDAAAGSDHSDAEDDLLPIFGGKGNLVAVEETPPQSIPVPSSGKRSPRGGRFG
jgi:hypothetical protein